MLFLTRWFGVTGCDAEAGRRQERLRSKRSSREVSDLAENAADQQQRPLCRGTHAKGVCARANSRYLMSRLGVILNWRRGSRKGIFSKTRGISRQLRFGNADPKVNSDFKPDVPIVSFSVDLTRVAP